MAIARDEIGAGSDWLPDPKIAGVALVIAIVLALVANYLLGPDAEVEQFLDATSVVLARPDSELSAPGDAAVYPLTPELVKIEKLRAYLARKPLMAAVTERLPPANTRGLLTLERLLGDDTLASVQLAFVDAARIASESRARICIGKDACFRVGSARSAKEGRDSRIVARLGDELGTAGIAVFMVAPPSAVGQVLVDPGSFRIDQLSPHLFAVSTQQVSGNPFLHDVAPHTPAPLSDLKADVSPARTAPTDTEFKLGQKTCPNPAQQHTIEVLVGTTQRAAAEARKIGRDLETQVRIGVGTTNTSFEESEITGRIAATVVETDFVELATLDLDRDELLKPNGALAVFRKKRSELKSDIAVLVVHDDNPLYCGKAADTGVGKEKAYAVVNWRCLTDNFALAHEIGHLVGGHHDAAALENGEVVAPPYAKGYVTRGTPQYATIMASQDSCKPRCGRLMAWSNPDVTHKNQPLGTMDQNFDACVWRQRFPVVAGFDGG